MFLTIDPKISTQVLNVNPRSDVLTYRNLALADTYTLLTKDTQGKSIEARLLAEITTLQQQLAKLKALIVELEATSNTEDE